MYGAGPTELITGGFVGYEPDEFQDPSHWDQKTDALEVNSWQWLSP